jgi:hypothetical protein
MENTNLTEAPMWPRIPREWEPPSSSHLPAYGRNQTVPCTYRHLAASTAQYGGIAAISGICGQFAASPSIHENDSCASCRKANHCRETGGYGKGSEQEAYQQDGAMVGESVVLTIKASQIIDHKHWFDGLGVYRVVCLVDSSAL